MTSRRPPPRRPLAPTSPRDQQTRGYVLLEIIIALTVFSISIAGLANSLHASIDSASTLKRQAAIRRGLEAILAEANARPKREDMILTYRDESLGIDYRTEVTDLRWTNRDGQPVNGLYLLRATAVDGRPAKPLHDSAEVYVFRP